MHVSVLASGSSGNAIYIESSKTKLLFDCGVSGKYIHHSMEKINRNPEDIQGIIVSHEHRDHIAGVGILNRKHNIPVYINKATYKQSIIATRELSDVNTSKDIEIGDIHIKSIKTSHDAVKPRAFIVSNKKTKLGIFTDLGITDSIIEKEIKSLHGVVLESNHDPEMLKHGPYPEMLKRRIASNHGHLSNYQAANLICEHARPSLRNVFLAHLSRTNNTPEMAYNTFTSTLWHRQDLKLGIDVTSQYHPTTLRKIQSKSI